MTDPFTIGAGIGVVVWTAGFLYTAWKAEQIDIPIHLGRLVFGWPFVLGGVLFMDDVAAELDEMLDGMDGGVGEMEEVPEEFRLDRDDDVED